MRRNERKNKAFSPFLIASLLLLLSQHFFYPTLPYSIKKKVRFVGKRKIRRGRLWENFLAREPTTLPIPSTQYMHVRFQFLKQLTSPMHVIKNGSDRHEGRKILLLRFFLTCILSGIFFSSYFFSSILAVNSLWGFPPGVTRNTDLLVCGLQGIYLARTCERLKPERKQLINLKGTRMVSLNLSKHCTLLYYQE